MHEDNDTVQEEVPMKLEDPPVSGGGGVTVVGATWSGGPAPQQSSIVVATPEDTKDGIEELCPVCGDKVSGYHYGLLTCESCKGFFKRTVQNKKVYTCVAERQCHIDKTQRKRCPFCRFQKCLEVGMKLEAVRADRMRGGRNKFGPMYKRDRARKLQLMRQRQMALGGNSAGALPGVTNAGAISGVNTGGINTGNNISSGGMGVVSGVHQQGIGSVYQGQGQFHIKQEIQIPQVSSLTSSPDSSPSPISVALGQIQQQHHHVPLHHTHHHQSGGAGPSALGASGGGALMMVDTKLWPGQQSPKPYMTTTPPPGAEHTSPTSHSKLGGGLNVSGANGGNSSVASGANVIGSGGNGNVTGSSGGNVIGGPVSGAGSGCAGDVGSGGLVRELVQAVDDREWQSSLYGLLQNQTYNQCEVDLFELMCKVLDQNLFSQVDWARNSVFFKDLKVDDQMKLLQHSWSDMLVLDHVHQRLHNSLPDETSLPNGQRFDLLSLGLLGVTQLADRLHQLSSRLQQVKWDVAEYICVKFMLLLNPDVRGISNRKHVQEGYEQVQLALQEYTATCYPQIQDKFNKLVSCLPEIHCIASRGEEHLYVRHCAGGAPTQTLLMEMLHAKRK